MPERLAAMHGFDLLAVAAVLGLGLAFLGAGGRPRRFAAPCAAVGLGWALALRSLAGPGPKADVVTLVAAALVATALGLALVGVMVERSVTLHLLLRVARGEPPAELQREIAARVPELVRLRLAGESPEGLRLTRRGRALAAAAASLGRVFAVDR
jgi:hypothetical protein